MAQSLWSLTGLARWSLWSLAALSRVASIKAPHHTTREEVQCSVSKPFGTIIPILASLPSSEPHKGSWFGRTLNPMWDSVGFFYPLASPRFIENQGVGWQGLGFSVQRGEEKNVLSGHCTRGKVCDQRHRSVRYRESNVRDFITSRG